MSANVENICHSVTGSAFYLTAVVIDSNLLVPIGTITVIGGGIWWLGRKLQQLEDGQKEINRRLDDLPCRECQPKKTEP